MNTLGCVTTRMKPLKTRRLKLHSLIAVDDAFEPLAIRNMVGGVFPVCINKHIDIGKDHSQIPS